MQHRRRIRPCQANRTHSPNTLLDSSGLGVVHVPYAYGKRVRMPPRQARTAITTRLTLESIVDAAAELIDADGLDALTMRRLAERCGVGAMTLYGYVRTKEELLGALADRFLSEIERPPVDDVAWGEQVASIFRSVRHTFLDHPELARIVALQPLHGVAAYR